VENWQPPEPEHGKFTPWNWLVLHPEHLKIGKGVDIGALTFLNAKQGIVLEDDVQIGPHCSIFSISTIDGKQGEIRICNGAKIGAHAVIMPGVIVHENAMVGAGAVVLAFTIIPANQVWLGVPARARATT
jgi:acetyltransferase-like isoleucine patch superfamily enzyme